MSKTSKRGNQECHHQLCVAVSCQARNGHLVDGAINYYVLARGVHKLNEQKCHLKICKICMFQPKLWDGIYNRGKMINEQIWAKNHGDYVLGNNILIIRVFGLWIKKKCIETHTKGIFTLICFQTFDTFEFTSKEGRVRARETGEMRQRKGCTLRRISGWPIPSFFSPRIKCLFLITEEKKMEEMFFRVFPSFSNIPQILQPFFHIWCWVFVGGRVKPLYSLFSFLLLG